ncbi:MAG: hypothetical protein H7Y01_11880 [Ferruginibacter sp.]|nr:hypothetical protein [Chitinophagaceae bacterium]
MENKFNNGDFEQFVKQNADQYRMFPSDKVWKGIHNTLHTRNRWYGIGLALLLLTTGVVTWVMLIPSGKNGQVVSTLPKITVQQTVPEKMPAAAVVIVPAKAPASKNSFVVATGNIREDIFLNDNTGTEPSIIAETGISTVEEVAYNNPVPVTKVEVTHQPESAVKTTPAVKQVLHNKSFTTPVLPLHTNSFSAINNTDNRETAAPLAGEKSIEKTNLFPFSNDNAASSFTQLRKRKKIELQVYFTPTISYRELKENKAFINSTRNATNGSTNAYYYSDINNVVTHKPDIGLQVGFNMGYPLSRNIKLIGGLQFNVSKYDIRAYTHTSEVATIALSTAAGGSNTVSALSTYRNVGGYAANWLHNLYFSASVPVGLELKVQGKRKSYLGVSGTVQPSYVLSNRAYLLSTDYNNYAEIPSLIRKWNINTGFEMFAGYTTGKLQWRVGPQVRYQVMSSFQKKYPVQEHLFDFGLKMGIMLNK